MARDFVVADTALVIDFLRDHPPGATLVERWFRERRLRLTSITAFELRLGADFSILRPEIERLLARRTLPLDALAATHGCAALVHLRRRGLGIDIRDALIAGVCLRFDLSLATRNTRHFDRVPGLRLELVTPS